VSAPAELRRVERAAWKLEAARLELEQAICAASAAGQPLRPIATVAGRSVEWTRRIIRSKCEEEVTLLYPPPLPIAEAVAQARAKGATS
jgi:hypothetical protein